MKTGRWFFLVVLFLTFSIFSNRGAATAQTPSGGIYYIKAEGVINPVMAEFLTGGLRRAEEEKAEAYVIQLDTPGGLDLSMREIIKAILSSDVPVVVYVAPAGSRAASAGVFITYAANVAAMAPGTNIGSAHPVSMGAQMDAEMKKKVENDAVAYIRGIALKRRRNADWAEKAVRQSVNITAEEALKLNVIDILAKDRATLFASLDGRKVVTASGTRTLHTAHAAIEEVEMGWRSRVLSVISNPNVAYILMMVGLLGIYFELSNPGAVLPGVIGAICLVLAFYSFQTLPVNYAGLLLIILGIVFFVIEVWVVSYGLLAVAGIVSLMLGSMMIFNSPLPFMRLSVWVMLPAVLFMTAFILWALYHAVSLHRRKPVSGSEQLAGEVGVAEEELVPGVRGRVSIEGEYWNVVSDAPVEKGGRVRVVAVEGLLLRVTRAEKP